ncbi:amidohydrolase family protein [Geodermatophilus sp. SYSU D00758]
MGTTPAGVLVEGARVFDGHRLLAPTTVLVLDGRIAALGDRLGAPAGLPAVRAEGATLLPGLVDAHVHLAPGALRAAVRFGVTTVVDMFADPAAVRSAKEEAATDPATADLRSAGIGATAPGGHPTRLVSQGLLPPFPTVGGPEEAAAFVAARVAEGSDHLKVVLEDGTTTGRPVPCLDGDTVRALVRAAHERGLRAVAHTLTRAHALLALDAGVDGLAHLFLDRPPSPGFVEAAVRSGAFVVPTLTSLAARAGHPRGRALAADPRIGPRLDPPQRSLLETAFPAGPGARADLSSATATAARLHEAGVPLLAGTDAGSPGTAHGAGLHDELALLVSAGLPPVDALAAATSAPAAAFGLHDRGRIAPGLRADLLLVRGDPGRDVTDARAVERVWRGGREAFTAE